MIEIKCKADIDALNNRPDIPKELIKKIDSDLKAIKVWSDYDNEYDYESNYHTDLNNNGYICIIEGNESKKELQERIGLTGGLDPEHTIPEEVNNFYFGGTKYSRVLIIYNDSYAMILYLINNSCFDSYVFDDNI